MAACPGESIGGERGALGPYKLLVALFQRTLWDSWWYWPQKMDNPVLYED